jgi:hypothetical protein
MLDISVRLDLQEFQVSATTAHKPKSTKNEWPEKARNNKLNLGLGL